MERSIRVRGRLLSSIVWLLVVVSISVALPARTSEAGTFAGRIGRIVLAGWDSRGDEIFTVNPDGTGLKELTAGASMPTLAPEWSPDGGRIAFARNYDIWVMNANGTGVTNLTQTPGVLEWHPAWSPDGSRIAFTRGGAAEIHVMDPDGTDVVNLGIGAIGPEWSPDGTQITFAHAADVYVMDAAGSNVTNLTNTPDLYERDPGWSPDGDRIVFSESVAGSAGQAGISVMDADGGNGVQITPSSNEDFYPTFSPDGQRIAFSSQDKIFLIDPDGSDRTAIVRRLQKATEPDWQAISLSVSVDTSEVNYGGEVIVTANLYWADATTNPNVSIFRRPLGGDAVLVTSGSIDGAGDLSAVVTVGKRTNLYATWAGDTGHPATKSPVATVIVHAIVSGRLSRHHAVKGLYRLYHVGIDPRYVVRVIPNHAGKRLYFSLQRRRDGIWRRIARVRFRIRPNGSLTVFVNASLLRIGVPYRIRAEFEGDRDHAGGVDAWRFFRVSSGSRLLGRRSQQITGVTQRLMNSSSSR
jgi:TolB protein